MLGFASGAMIVAVAFDLFHESYQATGFWVAGTGLILGALAFVGATALMDRTLGSTGGFYMLASITLDGVPENVALGVGLIGKSWTAIAALLMAIFFSNLPEAMGGSAQMLRDGRSRRFAFGVWTLTAAILTISVLIGHVALNDLVDWPLALARSIAAGAVIASLANALMPQAYDEGGKLVALATACGFLAAFVVTTG
jgi:ZIP family zinc transporter